MAYEKTYKIISLLAEQLIKLWLTICGNELLCSKKGYKSQRFFNRVSRDVMAFTGGACSVHRRHRRMFRG